ncbi:MAG: type IV secretion system DNA-binding domain-containing protein [Bacteroidota bacterium]
MTSSQSDQLSANFYTWEVRGRGWMEYAEPIYPEPPFLPFPGHRIVKPEIKDDTFRHSVWTWLGSRLRSRIPQVQEEVVEPVLPVHFSSTEECAEIQVTLAAQAECSLVALEQFLSIAADFHHPICFEIIGSGQSITFQFVTRRSEAPLLINQLRAFFPGVIIRETEHFLYSVFTEHDLPVALAEVALEEEFMRPLKILPRLELEPYTGLVAQLDQLQSGQAAVIQILFSGARNPWSASMMKSVTNSKGEAFFKDDGEMLYLAKEKVSQPLLAVNIRVLTQTQGGHAQSLAQRFAKSLIALSARTGSNSLGILPQTKEHAPARIDSIFNRTTLRTGMLLNVRELISFVHLPQGLQSSKLATFAKSYPAPEIVRHEEDYILGFNEHQGAVVSVGLPTKIRLRHQHLIGATGTGKSTLLINLILQNTLNESAGAIVLDPHGDLIEDIVCQIPKRLQDKVILIDPSDPDHAIGFNLLSATSEQEKIMVASDLAAIFKAQTSSWGDQMENVLQNAIAAFLDSNRGGTLLDLRKFLLEPEFRAKYINTITDPLIRAYWTDEFPKVRASSISSLLSRLQLFLRPKPVRYMLMQKEGLDFNQIIDEGKTLLVKLSQGMLGTENSYLLGSLLLTKIYQTALSRQRLAKSERNPVFVYLDEFQNFITPTLEGILSGARKYGLGLILAHQSMDQLYRRDPAVANSVIANAGTRICFRVGEQDARVLENGFAHFEGNDLLSLPIGKAIGRVLLRDQDFNLHTLMTPEVEPEVAHERYQALVLTSGKTFGVPISQLNAIMEQEYGKPIEIPFEEAEVSPETSKDVKIPKGKKEIDQNHSSEVEGVSDLSTAAEEQFAKDEARFQEREHASIQRYIKQIGGGLGFRSVVEAPTPDGKGRVDVLLTREKLTVACEVAVTTNNEHELGNVKKCLRAGYDHVLVITEKKERLKQLRQLIYEKLSEVEQRKVQVISKAAVSDILSGFVNQDREKEDTVLGYRVKTVMTPVSGDEADEMQDAILGIISKAKPK